MEKIPVIFATDNNFTKFIIVSMYSLMLNHKSESLIEFFILTDKEFSDDNKELINRKMQGFENCTITFIAMDDELEEIEIKQKRLSASTYYRLYIAERLNQYDKCIYLDGDIAVVGDIAELWNISIGNNLIAGVKGHNFYNREEHHRKRLDWPEEMPFEYINAGIIVMNLKAWREEKVAEKCAEYFDKALTFADQDTLNLTCMGRIQLLPEIFNVRPYYEGWFGVFTDPESEERKALAESVEKAVIFHYAVADKPWKDIRVNFADKWLEIALCEQLADLFPEVQELIDNPKLAAAIEEARNNRIELSLKKSENRKLRSENKALKKENSKYQKQIERIRNSGAYKIGRAVTAIPRKLKRAGK